MLRRDLQASIKQLWAATCVLEGCTGDWGQDGAPRENKSAPLKGGLQEMLCKGWEIIQNEKNVARENEGMSGHDLQQVEEEQADPVLVTG